MAKELQNKNWQLSRTEVFWGEIAPCSHVVQIYENNEVFLDALAGYVGGGINSGESVVVIATSKNLEALSERLTNFGIPVEALLNDSTYIPLNAERTLAKFMVDGWPDEALFNRTVSEILNQAKKKGRKVRAFGEMVAILWSQGHAGATVRLEHLWNKFCAKESFSLFCAYPKSGFTSDSHESMLNICKSHSKLISGSYQSSSETMFKSIA